MKKYGFLLYGGGENIFNGSKNPIEVVVNQIIDDGVSSRGHRKNILAPAHRTIGVASESHPNLGKIIVCKYAFHYSSLKLPEPLRTVISDWVEDDMQMVTELMSHIGGDKFKYKVSFSYPMLIKTTTILKVE